MRNIKLNRVAIEHIASIFLITALSLVLVRNYIGSAGYPAGWDVFSVILPTESLAQHGNYLSFYEDTSLGQTMPFYFGNILLS